jgi:hypothetical protein
LPETSRVKFFAVLLIEMTWYKNVFRKKVETSSIDQFHLCELVSAEDEICTGSNWDDTSRTEIRIDKDRTTPRDGALWRLNCRNLGLSISHSRALNQG